VVVQHFYAGLTNYAEDITAATAMIPSILHRKKTFILEASKSNSTVLFKNEESVRAVKTAANQKLTLSLIYSPLEELRTQKGEFPRTQTLAIIIYVFQKGTFPTRVK
jgi:hypothetical protein